MEMVRSKSGVAIADDFDSARGSPMVINIATGICYVVKADGSIVEIGALLSALTVSGLLSADGGQIKFPATQNPSSNVNTLDDYEEGTWTPVDSSGASLTFAAASGTYTKIGRLVTATAAVTYPATASGANAAIGGLPFTVGSASHTAGSYTTYANPITVLAFTATSVVFLQAAGGGASITNANMTSKQIIFTVSYEV